MIKLTVECETDTAHRLSCHLGKCRNLHGHRYKYVISVEGSKGIEDPKFIDFYDFKSVVKYAIDNTFDHATVLCNNDANQELIELLLLEDQKVVLTAIEPTVEAMVQMVYDLLKYQLKKNIVEITIYETPTNYCTKTFYGKEVYYE